jgi:fimbrial chaperone protein
MLRPSDQVLASPTLLDIRPASDSASGCCHASRHPLSANRPIGSSWPPLRQAWPRYSLPLFRGHATPMARPAACRIEPGQSHTFLRLSNTGTLHARLNDLAITSGGQRTLLLPGLAGYLLAGHERRWALPARAMATPAVISRPGCRMAA